MIFIWCHKAIKLRCYYYTFGKNTGQSRCKLSCEPAGLISIYSYFIYQKRDEIFHFLLLLLGLFEAGVLKKDIFIIQMFPSSSITFSFSLFYLSLFVRPLSSSSLLFSPTLSVFSLSTPCPSSLSQFLQRIKSQIPNDECRI